MPHAPLRRVALATLLVAGCAHDAADPPADPRDECATCAGKADGWGAPEPGSCEARGVVRVANEATFVELDDDAGLNRIAAEHLVAAREEAPFTTLAEVDDVYYVGVSALGALLDYAETRGFVAACDEGGPELELGVISDLDKTVIPPSDAELPEAPYPGVTTLYELLEHGTAGAGEAGDFAYVTARTPERVEGVPEWLADHSLPEGPIETGVSGLPWVAQPEKVRDISGVLDARPGQAFVLFGDSSHRDPEAYQEILAMYPERVRAGLIHRVTATVSEHRVEGLHLYESYPEAAAILVGLDLLGEADAWTVYDAAVAEGLEMGEDEMTALLAEHAG